MASKALSLGLGLCLLLAAMAPLRAALLIPTNSPNWRLLKGTVEASSPTTLWRGSNFNDSAFMNAPAPFWYGDARPGGTQLTDMINTYSCVFLRHAFVLNSVADITSLQMAFYIDDGFVMWINGVEVNRYAVTDPLTIATLAANQAVDPAIFETNNLSNPAPSSYLVVGTNYLCVQVFNTTLGSSDLGFDCQVISVPDVVAPTVSNKSPAPGVLSSLTQITVDFSEGVNGVDAADLLVNGAAATGVSGSGASYTFTFPQPAYGTVNITWAGGHGIQDYAITPNAFDSGAGSATWQYTLVDTTPPVMMTVIPATNSVVRELTQIEVLFSEIVVGVDVGDLRINGLPASTVDNEGPGQYVFTFPQPPTGVVSVAWAAGHGIQDTAVPPNNFGGGAWTYTLNPNAAFFDLRINEFMADNQNGIRDEDSSHQDWIEIYNAATTPVDLGGWYLTDNGANLTKWRFPSVQMPANSYLLVWASAKDRTNNIAALHTNFKLDPAGGFLGLIQPNGVTVVSSFSPTYPSQFTDASYGRDRLDPNIVGFYNVPTPNAPNAAGGPGGFASDVIYSVPSGTFVTPFNLALSTASTSAVIRYVLITNGTQAAVATNIPTASSPAYTGPIPITSTIQVRARAFQTGLFPSTPRSESYILLSANVQNFTSDRPICIVHNFAAGAVPTTPQTGIFMIFDNDLGRSSLTNRPQVATRMGFHIRGSSTLNQAKSNYRVEYWDEFNQDTKKPFLDMPPESDWVLYGINGFDPGLMHNAIFHWFGRQLESQTASRTRYVEVYRKIDGGPVTTNDYFGLYLVEENPKITKGRLDIDNLTVQDTNPPAITGGYLMRIDRTGAGYNWNPPAVALEAPQTGTAVGNTPANINIDDPKILTSTTDPRLLAQANYVRGYIGAFVTNLASVAYTNPIIGYAQYLDPNQWVDNLIGNIICFNVDGYRLSGYFYKDRSGRLKEGPYWDCDRCLGTGGTTTPQADNRCFSPRYWRLPANDVGTDNGTDFFGVSNVGVNWFRRLFRDPDFWQRFIDRYQAYRTNEYSLTEINAAIDGYYNQIKEAQVREQAKWGPANFTWPRSGVQTVNNYTFDFGPADNLGRGRFTSEVNFQKAWLRDRLEFMDTNFLAMPILSQGTTAATNGMVVTATPAAKAGSQLLYTLDGTDPRLPGGAVSPSALTSPGPLTLTISNTVRLFARSYNTSHANMTNSGTEVGKPLINSYWSGPVAATYYTAMPPLRVTEIMFHPAKLAADGTNDVDNFEYLECRNISGASLNVTGFRLRGGIEFDFPSLTLTQGQACVVVADVGAFQSRYGTNNPNIVIAGAYTNAPGHNRLGNGGDHIKLEGFYHEPILDFDYSDGWYPATDGGGFALQIVDQNAALDTWGLKSSWRPSGSLYGTPGTADPGAVALPPVAINEILTHPGPGQVDAIELYNPSGAPANLGGWFLTDDFKTPKKYRIANTVSVPATGYSVLYADTSFGSTFDLDERGGEIYLFSGDGTNLTGYATGFDFGAQAVGVTFGRHIVSTGNDQYPAQATPTLGATNAGPRVGPLVISEIMYRPLDIPTTQGPRDNTLDEYIEVENISGTPQPLFDPLSPENTWRLRDGVSFTFPTNVTIPAGGHVLVVSFDPVADPVAKSNFQSRNDPSAAAPIFGPYHGELDNSSDSIELVRPDRPQPPGAPDAGVVYNILVDKVNYSDSPPWDSDADGFGLSLQRIVPGAYGNDPANWKANLKTPGDSRIGQGPVIVQQPQSIQVLGTRQAMFSIVATGTTAIGYQWYFNDNVILSPASRSSIFIIPYVTPADAGTYRCLATNDAGSAFSARATLTYIMPPTITQQPTNVEVRIRPDPSLTDVLPNTNKSFYVTATSSTPLSYQWRVNGTNLIATPDHYWNVNTPTLTVTNIVMEDFATNYHCAVTDGNGTVFSSNATLYPLVRPTIMFPSLNTTQTVVSARPFPVSVVLSNGWPPPFGYLWRSSSIPIVSFLSNSKTNFCVVPTTPTNFVPTGAVAAVLYRVVVTNRASTTPTIGVAFYITTLQDADRDGIPDSVETALGLNPNDPADGLLDSDGDGISNVLEYQAGTDPTNSASYLRIAQNITSGVASVNFSAVSNRTYTVQYTDMLADPPANIVWQKLADVISLPYTRLEVFIDPAWTSNRFYRAVTPSQ